MAKVVEGCTTSNEYINVLLTLKGWHWVNDDWVNDDCSSEPVEITYYFAPAGVDSEDNGISIEWSLEGGRPAPAREAYIAAINTWATVADITFREVDSESEADFVEYAFAAGDASHDVAGPNGFYNIEKGAMADPLRLGPGTNGFGLLLHEIGHGLGLNHPFEPRAFPGISDLTPLGDYNLNQVNYTVMAYSWGKATNPLQPVSGFGGLQFGPMAFDIAAIQHLYGANTNHAGDDNIYVLGHVDGKPDGILAIWDSDGTDTIIYNGIYDATIDLRPATLENEEGGGGFISYVSGAPDSSPDHLNGYTIAADFTNALPDVNGETGVIIEKAIGGGGDDEIRGNHAPNRLEGNGGADYIWGLNSGDLIFGGSGLDHLYGGPGEDVIYGGGDKDIIEGGRGYDEIYGEDGDDEIITNDDSLRGDLVRGGLNNDVVYAGPNDRIWGEQGNDRIFLTDSGSGRAIIDGGVSEIDTFYLTPYKPNFIPVIYYIETVESWDNRFWKQEETLAGEIDTDIVISRHPAISDLKSSISAELNEIEEIVVGTEALDVTAPPLNVIVNGDFTQTDLDSTTITLFGTLGADDIKLSDLVSEHGVKFISNGGNDVIMGGNASTTVILSESFSNYEQIINVDGSLTLSSASGSSFTTDNHDIIIQDPGTQGSGVDFNIAPVAQNDSFTTNEDTPLTTGNLLADNSSGIDSDFDRDQLTVQVAAFATFHGNVSINADGTFIYTPVLNYFGPDSFPYTIFDGKGGQDTATATIEVLPVDDPAIIDGLVEGPEGAVTEDTPTLSTMGALTISDVDSPAEFQEGPYLGTYGVLELTKTGDWAYFLLNSHPDVQGRDSGETLSDFVVIKSFFDETEATIEITINGTDEPKGNATGQALDGTVAADGELTTGNGSDVVTGLSDNDVISTGNNDDLVQGGWGDDEVHGGNGSDTILGDAGNDSLFGDNGNDTIHGGADDDDIHGGNGKDILHGDEGEDELFGGNDKDILIGGVDPDLFYLELDGALDTVKDLEIDADGAPIDHIGLVDGITVDDVTVENYKKGGVLISVGGIGEMLIENVADATTIIDGFFLNG